jgi:hypothetical protein
MLLPTFSVTDKDQLGMVMPRSLPVYKPEVRRIHLLLHEHYADYLAQEIWQPCIYATNSLFALEDHLGNLPTGMRICGLYADEFGDTGDGTGYLVV